MATVQEVLDDVWFLLNDVDGSHPVFTQTKMLVAMNKAYRDLQRRCHLDNIQVLSEISTIIDLAANTTVLLPAAIAADFLMPVELSERADDSSDLFTPMDEKDWEPETERTETLRWWTWREESIKFVGATTARELKIKFVKSLTPFTAGGLANPVGISESQDFLAAKAAAIVSTVMGENYNRAEALNNDAMNALDDFLSIHGKKRQNLPVRRRAFRRPRRLRTGL